MNTGNELEQVARALVAPGKGILAADESFPSIEKRFKSVNLASSEDSRRAYREMLFTAPHAERYISGVILFDETIRQKAHDGTPLPQVLSGRGIIPGIKVDAGTIAMPGSPKEKITEGLDGLRQRVAEYYKLGARFAKWRAVITIGDGMPSRACIGINAESLACYAALCQEGGLVPIVEPEVLMDGNHSIERCEEVTEQTLHVVFRALRTHGVVLERMLLKPNMVIAGKECPVQASVQQVAEATLRCFRRTVPAAVPGIVFLSGGQSEKMATVHLNAINQAPGPRPWAITFSYGRALQDSPLNTWRGEAKSVAAGQLAFSHRARLNGAAQLGRYSEAMEAEASAV